MLLVPVRRDERRDSDHMGPEHNGRSNGLAIVLIGGFVIACLQIGLLSAAKVCPIVRFQLRDFDSVAFSMSGRG
ncbi:uncharacterized protein LY89DRAFT_439863 [Mollisia scopiformis]|uniref:Uncharacterized protein n=1 Tax=Mollisia scopiformis TaxID=149040 RepID=A0A194XJK0_MOLSC|nr:uncharacterized protein LY89DRAFT_439863 [Mollisia scopiformis]KUJ20306.1 hypothetical protein LY89DRAFT_439863 [Mollisia scopiformis]